MGVASFSLTSLAVEVVIMKNSVNVKRIVSNEC